jgi:hypothetical protein
MFVEMKGFTTRAMLFLLLLLLLLTNLMSQALSSKSDLQNCGMFPITSSSRSSNVSQPLVIIAAISDFSDCLPKAAPKTFTYIHANGR